MAELKLVDAKRMSHAYIISAQSMEDCLHTAGRLAAAAVCSSGQDSACGHCRDCRKAQAGVHPDIISVARLCDDKGRPKREIGVDQIRQMSSDAVVLPNEANRKVYIIQDADTMNIPAQNAALKLLEEPPAGALFLLCVTNAGQLLQTVRSRCVELNLNGQDAQGDENSMKLARAYLKSVASGDRAKLCSWCFKNDGLDTRAAGEFLDSAVSILEDMLCSRLPDEGMSRKQMMELIRLLESCVYRLRVNVGVKHIFGLLAVDSISGSGNRG